MHDKRALKRRNLIYYLEVFETKNDSLYSRVFERENGPLAGHLVDVTTEGLMLLSEKPVEVGAKFKFRMVLPEFMEESGEIGFEGICAWSKRDVNPDYYLVGFKFDKLPEKKIKLINQLVMEAGFQD